MKLSHETAMISTSPAIPMTVATAAAVTDSSIPHAASAPSANTSSTITSVSGRSTNTRRYPTTPLAIVADETNPETILAIQVDAG